MNATSVRHLSQMAQEGDQEALIWGETMEMMDVAEEDMIVVATGGRGGYGRGLQRAGVRGQRWF